MCVNECLAGAWGLTSCANLSAAWHAPCNLHHLFILLMLRRGAPRLARHVFAGPGLPPLRA